MPLASPSIKRRFLVPMLLIGVGAVAVVWLLFCFYNERHQHAEHWIEWGAGQAGVELDAESVIVEPEGFLELRNVKLGADGRIGKMDYLQLRWSWRDLLHREVAELRVHGVELRLSELTKLGKKRQPNGSDDVETASKIQPFKLNTLIIGQAVLLLDNLGPGIPPLPVRLGEATPLVFEDLSLGGPTNDPAAEKIQFVEINDLAIYSPYDLLAEAIRFKQIRMGFSWAGIQAQQIDRLTLIEPTLFVGEELFWLVDEVTKQTREADAEKDPSAMPWKVGNFEVLAGRLVVTTLGRPGFTLPVIYETRMSGLVLDNFAQTPMRTSLTIPLTNLSYPEYGVRVNALRGDLQFSLPPDEVGAQNIVGTIHMNAISWKGVTATDAWVALTFDKNGIYGELGGSTYGGYTNGNLSILVNEGLRWVANASVTETEVRAIAEKLSPQHILVDGPVSGVFVVDGRQKEITAASGDLIWNKPGRMTVLAIDDLLARLPEGWTSLKKDAAGIALSAFRDYDYHAGACRFRYGPPSSYLDLQFDGLQGKREFSLRWHDLRDKPGFGWNP